jgi:hypothetical protein
MDNINTLELEILITVRQNKNVSTCHFHHLFEHKWKLYQSRFDELLSGGVFEIVTPLTGVSIYNLTGKGQSRIKELLDQREERIAIRLAQSKQRMPIIYTSWKTLTTWINSVLHLPGPTANFANSKPKSDFSLWNIRIGSKLNKRVSVKA